MHPERRGQRGGRIDAGVAVLDAIGLLLFVIPGVIAFAVDFSTGAIYLPEKSRTSLDINNMKIVRFDSKHATDASIEYIIKKETGIDVKLWQKNIKISRISSINDVRE
ncbi:MAG TPA: polyribonucleotide nucleotidyltransferase [Elusimicrobia bacterium]|nr:polyribonucleotide nucleotidyltransferase [Elusimicrobiota bacterium]